MEGKNLLPRRTLLLGLPSATVGAGLSSLMGFGVHSTDPLAAAQKPVGKAMQLAGMSLRDLRAFYQAALDRELQFWSSHGIDPTYGGFMCAMDWDGTQLDTNKDMSFQGRGLWVYSFLYRHFGKNPSHLETARRTKDFLFKHGRGGDGTWPDRLNREGRIIEPFKGQIYSGLYVALGLQEYAKVADDGEAWDESRRTFLKCLELYDQPDYGRGFEEAPPGSRIQAVEMVLIDVLTEMLEKDSDPQLKTYQGRTVNVLTEKFFNPGFRLHNEVLRHDYSRYPDEPWRDHVELGFSISNFFGILFEARRRRDHSLMRQAAQRLRRHLEVAWDDIYGGLGWSTRVESGCFNYQKASYVHQEAMIGLLTVLDELGEDWTIEWYNRLHRFAFEKFPVTGYSAWQTYMDRKCTPQPHSRRRENFHQPRFLMLAVLAVDRLLRQEGRGNTKKLAKVRV